MSNAPKRKGLGKTWDLPIGPVDETGEYVPIPKRARTIPFGYELSTENENILLPVIDELVALEEAAGFIRNKQYSIRQVAHWLSEISGRTISHSGLDKRLKVERKRSSKKKALAKDEAKLRSIIQAQEEIERSLGQKEAYTESEARA
tara:strand:+ start:1550 stop:1990 length:441 start_codon:yes stop_codon:yes gene_type:complete